MIPILRRLGLLKRCKASEATLVGKKLPLRRKKASVSPHGKMEKDWSMELVELMDLMDLMDLMESMGSIRRVTIFSILQTTC